MAVANTRLNQSIWGVNIGEIFQVSITVCFCAHHIGPVFQVCIIIYGHSAHFGCRFDTVFHLLGNMPCLVGQMLLLTWSDIDVCTLCISQSLHGPKLRCGHFELTDIVAIFAGQQLMSDITMTD